MSSPQRAPREGHQKGGIQEENTCENQMDEKIGRPLPPLPIKVSRRAPYDRF